MQSYSFIVVQLLSCVWLFATPWALAQQASLSFTISWSLLGLIFIELMMPSNHVKLFHPLLLPSVFPSIKTISSESAFPIRWPKYWSFSLASTLPINIQRLFHLGLTGLISLLSKGLSRVFSSTTFWKNQFFGHLYGQALKSIHNYWNNHSFDYTDLCQQSDVSAL